MTALSSRRFGWVPDVPDYRDKLFRVTRANAISLPLSVPTIGLANRIEDQGELGSCTGHATTAMLEINYDRALRAKVTKGSTRAMSADDVTKKAAYQDLAWEQNDLSRLMAYYLGRKIDNTVREDAGARIRSVIKGLTKSGCCSEGLWPYKPSTFSKTPNAALLAAANILREDLTAVGLKYYRVRNLTELRRALAAGYTVTFGFAVPATIDKITAKRNVLAVPKSKVDMLGGHAVLAVGYTTTSVIVRNSWGESWGKNGYFQMSNSWWTTEERLVDDMWVLMP